MNFSIPSSFQHELSSVFLFLYWIKFLNPRLSLLFCFASYLFWEQNRMFYLKRDHDLREPKICLIIMMFTKDLSFWKYLESPSRQISKATSDELHGLRLVFSIPKYGVLIKLAEKGWTNLCGLHHSRAKCLDLNKKKNMSWAPRSSFCVFWPSIQHKWLPF